MKTLGVVMTLAVLAGNGLVYALESLKGNFDNAVQHRVSMIDDYGR